MSLGIDVWTSVVVNYNVPDIPPPIDEYGKKLYLSNDKSKRAILASLNQSELVKVMHCKSAYEMWEKLNQCHEGDEKVKQAKL